MTINDIQVWMEQNPILAFGGAVLVAIIVFFIARSIVARGLYYLAEQTENKYDDIIVAELHPFRVAYVAPLVVIYYFAFLLPQAEFIIQQSILFLILWVVVFTFNSLLSAVNQIYESAEGYSGVPIQGYLDLVKILFLLVGLILSISLITGESPLVLLTGLGALTAVLLLIFRDTILSFVASIQISAQDLVKEGDWIEVPGYGADGDVIDMSLHTVKIQNWDKTISVLPTYKLIEAPYKNWRGMSESGGRRIKRAIYLDIGSIRFLQTAEVEELKRIRLLGDYLKGKQAELEQYNHQHRIDNRVRVNQRRLTNVGTFRAYIDAYLRAHPGLHHEGMTLLVRQLAPGEHGLPLELYVFSKTTEWVEYEGIQADIFDHLLAVAPEFGLRVFQNPTGADFSTLGAN